MKNIIKVLYLAAEFEPFIKIGGLADVAGSLPLYLRSLSSQDGYKLDIRAALPLHRGIKLDMNELVPFTTVCVARQGEQVPVTIFLYYYKALPIYFFKSDLISNAPSVYAHDQAQDRDKYTLFCLACMEFIHQQEWKPDIVHANDWHTAMVLHALRTGVNDVNRDTHTLLTLHNLPYMGGEGSDVLGAYQLEACTNEQLPTWARTQPLPMGLASADHIIPVSPQYGREILTPTFGCGLEGYLQTRAEDIFGILNGLDVSAFDPGSDDKLSEKFSTGFIGKRISNKRALQVQLDLPENGGSILLGMVGRINLQKGIDIALGCMEKYIAPNWQFVLLGSGDASLEAEALALQTKYPGNVRIVLGYDEALGRLIYGGGDIFLMPSRYEPCGLAQMIAMRYGCVPVVRATGGLMDTVQEGKTGFLFEQESAEALFEAITRATAEFSNTTHWMEMQTRGMSQDFSWVKSAQKYRDIYIKLMNRRLE